MKMKKKFRSRKNKHTGKHQVIPISAPVEQERATLGEQGVTVVSQGRRGLFGRLKKAEVSKPWYVRLLDEEGKIFNLKVIAHNENEAREKTLKAFPKAKMENVVRVSPYKEGLARSAVKTIGRKTVEAIKEFLRAPTKEEEEEERRTEEREEAEAVIAEKEAGRGLLDENGDNGDNGHSFFDDNGNGKAVSKKGTFRRKSEEHSGGVLGGDEEEGGDSVLRENSVSDNEHGFFD